LAPEPNDPPLTLRFVLFPRQIVEAPLIELTATEFDRTVKIAESEKNDLDDAFVITQR
jgi:hypothetical protein